MIKEVIQYLIYPSKRNTDDPSDGSKTFGMW